MRRILSVAMAALALSGCYQYAPLTASELPSGLELRAHLTDQGAVNLAPRLGASTVAVDGKVLNTSQGALTLAISQTINRSQFSTMWQGEQVEVSRNDVARFERRTLDRKRSFLVGGAVAVAVVLLGNAFNLFDGSAQGSPGGGPPPPPASIQPLMFR